MLSKYIELLHRKQEEAEAETGGGAEENISVDESVATDEVSASESTEADADDGDAGDSETGDEQTSYADYEMPEGVELDDGLVEKFNPLMQEYGLSQDQAQGLATELANHVQANETAQQDAFEQQLDEWVESAKSDKEFGGDKYDESLGIAQSFINSQATPEFKQLLDDSGLGNNPEMIRMMYRAGMLFKEDSVGKANPVSPEKDAASILYPN